MTTEDGTGVIGANSYSALDAANAYHLARANEDWAEVDTPTAWLIIATDWIEAHYQAIGARRNPLQGLQCPTTVYDLSPVVAYATAYLALRASAGDLDVKPRGIKSSKKTLEGVGATEITYDEPTGGDPFPIVTGLLAGVMERRDSTVPTIYARRMIG